MTANPTLLSMPLAQNGQKNVIPTTQATAGDGLFSQSTGFPAETSLPLGAGGVAPSREDFNGMANLLGGVAFMAQKGFTFNYDAGQDYYTGCVVIDPIDGNRYECIADMAAGTIAPHDDTTNTYWKEFGVDTSALANTDLSNLTQDGEDHFLENDFTIIYPNGGTATNPANITSNSRYVEANPFAGYIVACIPEILFNNEWGNPEWYDDYQERYGVRANQFNHDSIIIQTSETGVSERANLSGRPFANTSKVTSAPCRVKVWKIGKVASA